jgi:hypothetical protein
LGGIKVTDNWRKRYNKEFMQLFGDLDIQWNLGSRTPLFTNNSVHEQIFRAKNVSDDERCLGLPTRKLATAASLLQRQAESIGAGVSVAG